MSSAVKLRSRAPHPSSFSSLSLPTPQCRHLAPLFDNPKLDKELRAMLREKFPEFCSSPSPPIEGRERSGWRREPAAGAAFPETGLSPALLQQQQPFGGSDRDSGERRALGAPI